MNPLMASCSLSYADAERVPATSLVVIVLLRQARCKRENGERRGRIEQQMDSCRNGTSIVESKQIPIGWKMSQVIKISLDDMGRILIPAAVQSRLGLSPGMSLVVEEGDQGGVRLRVQSELPVLVDKAGVLVVREVTRRQQED